MLALCSGESQCLALFFYSSLVMLWMFWCSKQWFTFSWKCCKPNMKRCVKMVYLNTIMIVSFIKAEKIAMFIGRDEESGKLLL